MSNVLQFKTMKEIKLEELGDLTLWDLFCILQDNIGAQEACIFYRNETGDVSLVSSHGLANADTLLDDFFRQELRNGLN